MCACVCVRACAWACVNTQYFTDKQRAVAEAAGLVRVYARACVGGVKDWKSMYGRDVYAHVYI